MELAMYEGIKCFLVVLDDRPRSRSIFVSNEDTSTMNTAKKTTGAAIAIAAAAMLASAPITTHAGQTGKCMGANSCKGHSSCKTATSSCKGMNACKGQGFLEMTKAQCDEAGGNFEA